jgi:transaldolase
MLSKYEDVNLGMPENPKEMLPENRRTTCLCVKELCSEVALQRQHDLGGRQRGKKHNDQEHCYESQPNELRHPMKGQSLWLDNITRDLLNSGTLNHYIEELSVTRLTSNPTIFDHAIKNSSAYDVAIRKLLAKGETGERLFFDLALDDLTQAADLFLPVYDRTNGVDGWVSLEVSPLLAHDTPGTIAAAKELSARAGRSNLFIKIPGTKEGLPAIEETIFAGVPVNVTLLFSRDQYVAAAEAYLRGIERRIEARLNPQVASVASVFISRWDAAVAGKVSESLENQLGIAIAGLIYRTYVNLLINPNSRRAYNAGARPQRLLWASTGTKDPQASDTLYVAALAAPFTVNTMPEKTLNALSDHGEIGPILAADGGDCETILRQFAQDGVDVEALAARLEDEGTKSFVKSWGLGSNGTENRLKHRLSAAARSSRCKHRTSWRGPLHTFPRRAGLSFRDGRTGY